MINIVCGPPGSGKTTYVLKEKHRGDVIIDLDLLFQAVTGLPMYDRPEALLGFVIDLKRAAIEQAVFFHTKNMISNVWIITGGAKAEDRCEIARYYRADHVYVLNPSTDECVRRISLDTRRNSKLVHWRKIVQKWKREFQPWASDEYLDTSSMGMNYGPHQMETPP